MSEQGATVTTLVPRASLTPASARSLTEAIKADAEKLWTRLLSAYERGVHTALGYPSWQAYMQAEFGAKSSASYRVLDAGRVAQAIEAHSPNGESPAIRNESVARELVTVLREEGEEAVTEAWTDVVN